MQKGDPMRRPGKTRTTICARALCALAVLAVAACAGDGDRKPTTVDASDPSAAGDTGDDSPLDSGEVDVDGDTPDIGEPEDTGPEPEETSTDAGASQPSPIGMRCSSDDPCSDGIYCNGEEFCDLSIQGQEGVCRAAPSLPCPQEHHCLEEDSRLEGKAQCDCTDPDFDNDGEFAIACEGLDCDDTRDWCNTDGVEVCDAQGLNEDCKLATFSTPNTRDGDRDNDGYLDVGCFNIDPTTKKRRGGNDCDDHNPYVSPHNPEVCNYRDDNCNGRIDEVLNSDGTFAEGGLMVTFLPDQDRDLRGDAHATPLRACDFYQPRGYILANGSDASDCDDKNPQAYLGAIELCDGVDNDCDGKIDALDDNLTSGIVVLPETTLQCAGAKWTIPAGGCPPDKLWCAGDPIERGCERNATRLSNCRECGKVCHFSCGRDDCDEIEEVSNGDQHACARTREGRVACWGRGEAGRLGTDSVAQAAEPTFVVGISDVRAISAGANHTCAIAGPDRTLYCWGKNESLQLGNPDAGEFSTTPVPVWGVRGATRLNNVAQVAAGAVHTCAVLAAGDVVCFGQAAGGTLGNALTDARRTQPAPALRRGGVLPGVPFPLPQFVVNARLVAVGRQHTCIVTQAGTVECTGANTYGQVGLSPDAVPDGYFTPVPQLANVSALAAGDSHTCAASDGTVSCWGADEFLQLGRAATPDRSEHWIPKPVAGLSDVAAVSAGGQFSCASTHGGSTTCWGSNSDGQLGPAFVGASTNNPVLIPDGISRVDCGLTFVCGLSPGHRAFCWGANALGQIGTNSLERTIRIPQQLHPVTSAIP